MDQINPLHLPKEEKTSIKEKSEPRYQRIRLADAIPLPSPFNIYVDSSSMCNFKCRFCPCNNSNNQSKEHHQIMSWDVFQKVLYSLRCWKEDGHPVKVIYLHGIGEPLLNPHIVDMVRAIKEEQLCREVRLVTNGSLLTPVLGQQLIDAGVDMIRISIEALTTEGYKELCDANVDFEQIVQNIRSIYQYSRETSSKISVKIFSSSLKSQEDVETFYKIFAPISDYHYTRTIRDIWPSFKKDLSESTGKPLRKICTQPFTTMLIHPNGGVSTCCVDWNCQTVYGTVKEETLNELWTGERLKHLQLMHLNHSAYQQTVCSECSEDSSDDEVDDCAEQIEHRLLEQRRNFNEI